MPTSYLLLREMLRFLEDLPGYTVDCGFDDRGKALAERIETFLRQPSEPPHPAIATARARWSAVSFLRIDPGERRVDVVPDGIWVRGWIKVGIVARGDIPPDVAKRYDEAIAMLPILTRRVFIDHHAEGLDYAALARRYAISPGEVEKRIAEALSAIGKVMRST